MAQTFRARGFARRFILLDSFLVVFGFYLVIPLVSVHFVDGLGWAAAAVGLALAARQLMQQGLGPLGGSLAERFGAKPLIVSGMLLRASGFATMAYASHPALLVLSCMLAGLGGMLFDPPRNALVIKLIRPGERGRFYARMMMQESVGAALGSLAGAWLLHFDFHWVGWGDATMFCLAALANALWLPAWRVSVGPRSAGGALRRVWTDRAYLRLVLTFAGYYVLTVQTMLLLPLTLKQLSGSAAPVGWMYALQTALSLSLLYPLARLGERRLSLAGRILAGMGLMGCALLLMSAAGSLAAAFLIWPLFYIGGLVVEPAREMLFSRLAHPQARAAYAGTSRFGLAIGGFSGYVGGGWLLDSSRAMNAPALPWFALAAICALTMALIARQLLPQKREARLAAGHADFS